MSGCLVQRTVYSRCRDEAWRVIALSGGCLSPLVHLSTHLIVSFTGAFGDDTRRGCALECTAIGGSFCQGSLSTVGSCSQSRYSSSAACQYRRLSTASRQVAKECKFLQISFCLSWSFERNEPNNIEDVCFTHHCRKRSPRGCSMRSAMLLASRWRASTYLEPNSRMACSHTCCRRTHKHCLVWT